MKINNKIKAIIFDVDGVLFKTHDQDGNYLWCQTIQEDLGISKEHLKYIFSSDWNDVLTGSIETMQYFQKVFKEPTFNDVKNITPEIFMQYWITKDCYINWDIIKLINSLNTPCYLGTNQENRRTKLIIELIGDHFKHCFASYSMGHIKPEPLFFEHIEKFLNLSPEELLLIDDTDGNIESAKKCGWLTYHYQNDFEDLNNFISKLACS